MLSLIVAVVGAYGAGIGLYYKVVNRLNLVESRVLDCEKRLDAGAKKLERLDDIDRRTVRIETLLERLVKDSDRDHS